MDSYQIIKHIFEKYTTNLNISKNVNYVVIYCDIFDIWQVLADLEEYTIVKTINLYAHRNIIINLLYSFNMDIYVNFYGNKKINIFGPTFYMLNNLEINYNITKSSEIKKIIETFNLQNGHIKNLRLHNKNKIIEIIESAKYIHCAFSNLKFNNKQLSKLGVKAVYYPISVVYNYNCKLSMFINSCAIDNYSKHTKLRVYYDENNNLQEIVANPKVAHLSLVLKNYEDIYILAEFRGTLIIKNSHEKINIDPILAANNVKYLICYHIIEFTPEILENNTSLLELIYENNNCEHNKLINNILLRNNQCKNTKNVKSAKKN